MLHDLDMIGQLQHATRTKKQVGLYPNCTTKSTILPELRDMGIYYPKTEESMRLILNDQGKLSFENGCDIPTTGKFSLFYITNQYG